MFTVIVIRISVSVSIEQLIYQSSHPSSICITQCIHGYILPYPVYILPSVSKEFSITRCPKGTSHGDPPVCVCVCVCVCVSEGVSVRVSVSKSA